jgi:hypothetical protein
MIEIRVWGDGEAWHAAVVKPTAAPAVSSRRADLAALRALTAYRHATDKSEVTCHRCGNVWRPRLKGAQRLPVICPRCKQPPRYSALREIGLHAKPRRKDDAE